MASLLYACFTNKKIIANNSSFSSRIGKNIAHADFLKIVFVSNWTYLQMHVFDPRITKGDDDCENGLKL